MRLAINIFGTVLAASCLAIAACGGDGSSDAQSPATANTNATTDTASAPVMKAVFAISGSPATSDAAGVAYSFVPMTTNSGGTLTFSVSNLPSWAVFSTGTGAITGTPGNAQVGAYANILISVSNGNASTSLAAFSLNVTAGSASKTGAANLSWTPPTQNTDGTSLNDLAGYTISYGTDQGAMTQTVQLNSPSATSYVVGNLSAGTYYFAVAAYSSDGSRSSQSLVGSTTIL